jgi:Gas vesicle protein G
MLLVDDILFFPVTSIFWIFREINKIAHDELAGEAQSISEQLRVLYMQLETGRITEAQFDAEEKLLLDRLDVIDRRLKSDEEPEEPGIAAQEDDTGNP